MGDMVYNTPSRLHFTGTFIMVSNEGLNDLGVSVDFYF